MKQVSAEVRRFVDAADTYLNAVRDLAGLPLAADQSPARRMRIAERILIAADEYDAARLELVGDDLNDNEPEEPHNPL